MITPATMGWMAGIIDLKGRIYTKKNQSRATPQVVLMVESRYPGIVRRLGELVGTRPEVMQSKPLKDFMRRGCREHCAEPHVHVNDDRIMPGVYRWTVTGLSMAIVLKALEPLLIEDKAYQEHADEVLAVAAIEGQGSAATLAAVNRMHLLGWPLPEKVTRELERRELAVRVLTTGGGQEDETGPAGEIEA